MTLEVAFLTSHCVSYGFPTLAANCPHRYSASVRILSSKDAEPRPKSFKAVMAKRRTSAHEELHRMPTNITMTSRMSVMASQIIAKLFIHTLVQTDRKENIGATYDWSFVILTKAPPKKTKQNKTKQHGNTPNEEICPQRNVTISQPVVLLEPHDIIYFKTRRHRTNFEAARLVFQISSWNLRAHRQHCCWGACQISQRSYNFEYKSRAFDTLREFNVGPY